MSFWDIIWLITHGFLQYILWLAPIVKPVREAHWAPGWWYTYWGAWDWTGNLDAEDRPNQIWCEKFIWAAFSMFRDEITKIASWYTDSVVAIYRSLLGYLPSGFSSFSSWLYQIRGLIGLFMPSWARNLVDGLNRLWNWLPIEIRNNIASWWNLFQDAVNRATDWARARYEDARNRIYQLFDWWVHLGHNLGVWWTQARGVLDAFRSNPTGFIIQRLGPAWNWLIDFRQDARNWVLGWLGSAWPLLSSFAAGPLRFYYDLWGSFRATLFGFLTDPLEFLWDGAEDFLSRKW